MESPSAISPTTPLSPAMAPKEEDNPIIPELSDAEYLLKVLRLPRDKSEVDADNDLVARANAMGIAATLPSVASKRHATLSTCSYSSLASSTQERSFSTASNASASSVPTPHSSIFGPPSPLLGSEPGDRRASIASLNFSQYERYLGCVDSNLDRPKFLSAPPASDSSGQSLFSVSTKKSLGGGFRNRLRRKKRSTQPLDPTLSCISCRQGFERSGPLHNLACGHTHCAKCLKNIIKQAVADEASMPPRCCSQAVPTPTVRAVLNQGDQENFLLAILKFNTPTDDRIFCPDEACGEFVPPQDIPDPKFPFDISCLKCDHRVCIVCKQTSHPTGEDCPQDWELAAMNKLRDSSRWKRCYQCRNLAEVNSGTTHMTCKCTAQFCSICLGIWDPTTGCPNLCNFDEELEKRRLEDEDRKAKAETATTSTNERSRANSTIQRLGKEQQEQLRRFLEYKSHTAEDLQIRHMTQKSAVMEKYTAQEEKVKERHDRTVSQLEDRQIAAEMELRSSLEQSERSMRLRLKHMEAYCEGLGLNPNSTAPIRVVTERDLRELGQQYNLRDDMDRMHQSKINVMRDRQAKQMEELLDRQETELEKLFDRRQGELDKLEATFAQEDAQLKELFDTRQSRMHPRWVLAIEVLCKELEEQTKQTYSRMAPPRWPEETQPAPQKECEPENTNVPAVAA